MRDREASRGYSPEAEEFRRVHEEHRAWAWLDAMASAGVGYASTPPCRRPRPGSPAPGVVPCPSLAAPDSLAPAQPSVSAPHPVTPVSAAAPVAAVRLPLLLRIHPLPSPRGLSLSSQLPVAWWVPCPQWLGRHRCPLHFGLPAIRHADVSYAGGVFCGGRLPLADLFRGPVVPASVLFESAKHQRRR
jgi:hypothetical protein